MKIMITDKSMNDNGKVYEVELVQKFVNGIKVRNVKDGEVAFIERHGFKIVEE